MTEKLVNLQEMKARFENVKGELEIATANELTIPVTISIYRGQDEDGSIPSLYCHLQFEGDGYWADLVGPDNEMVSSLEDVCEAFNIPLDAKMWEVTIEDEEESE